MSKQPDAVRFKPEWREAECPRCERYVRLGERVYLRGQLGDGWVEVEHVHCPDGVAKAEEVSGE